MGPESSSQPAQRRVYRNPPIVEAIVELRFVGGDSWNLTIPGRFYDRIRNEYPDEPEHREIVEAAFGSGTDPEDPMVKLSRREQRVLMKRGNQLVLIGPNVISVNSLKPYEGWDSLRPRVRSALDAYRSVVKPEAVAGIGVRYINRIEVPGDPFRFEEYFTVAQGLPSSGFPKRIKSFFDRMELVYDDIPATIAFTWATAESAKEDRHSFLLDLDLRWQEACNFDDALANVDELRNRERVAFESLLRDELREIFDADDNS